MKKFLLLFVTVCILMILFSQSIQAQDETLDVPYITTELTMDADESDWPNSVPYVELDKTINKIEPRISDDPLQFSSQPFATSDLSGYFRLGWDGDFIYIFVYVDDDVDANQGDAAWKNDNIEIFFNCDLGNDLPYDGNNSNYKGSDGVTDAIQFRWGRNLELYTEKVGKGAGPGWIIKTWPEDSGFEWAIDNTPSSYALEVKIPLAELFKDHTNVGEWVPDGTPLVVEPEPGFEMGFEVMVTDYDGTSSTLDNDNRNGHIVWANSSGNDLAYRNTGLMGTITLLEQATSINGNVKGDVKIYPNPFFNTLFISGLDNVKSLQVQNLLGQEVLSLNEFNQSIQLDLAGFENGIYLLSLEDIHGNTSTKKIIKQ